MFVGRSRELKALGDRYAKGQFEFAVIYGRRRVGKTALINEFIKDKEAIFYTGMESNAKENLERLSQSIFSLSEDFAGSDTTFASYAEALERVFMMSLKRRIILAIDEYPYVAGAYHAISSLLQGLIDKYSAESKLFLILCGSSLSFMEVQVLGYKSPLYGRRTCQFKILPFDFFETRAFFKGFTDQELAVVYGFTGGVPMYLSLVDDTLSVEENIKACFLYPSSYLFEEPSNLIKQECRDPANYNAIIRAIANGATRLNEIGNKAGLESNLTSSAVGKLVSLGIVRKEGPIGGTSTRKSIYVLDDMMFRFWFRFIPNNLNIINAGMEDRALRRIQPELPVFMGAVFEEICKQYLWRLNAADKAAVDFTEVGRWWGNDPIQKKEAEIDIVATDNEHSAIFCECKWQNEHTDIGVLHTLMARSNLLPKLTNKHFILFSKSGFTKGCMEKAESLNNVQLTCFDEMTNVFV